MVKIFLFLMLISLAKSGTTYVEAEFNTNDCPSGSEEITTEDECKLAATALSSPDAYKMKTPLYDFPKGCMRTPGAPLFFFNYHATGGPSSNKVKVCKQIVVEEYDTICADCQCNFDDGSKVEGTHYKILSTQNTVPTGDECYALKEADPFCDNPNFGTGCYNGDCWCWCYPTSQPCLDNGYAMTYRGTYGFALYKKKQEPAPTGACPSGWSAVGTLSTNNDVEGDGLGKYVKDTIDECKDLCINTAHCKAFMFGGKTDAETNRCELSRVSLPNNNWGTNWRFCKKNQEAPHCPRGYTQKGTLSHGNDIAVAAKAGESLENSIEMCRMYCSHIPTCVAFMYGGEDLSQTNNCKLSSVGTPTRNFGSNWRFCGRESVQACPAGYSQVGTLSNNNDVRGGGAGQFIMTDIDECKNKCESIPDCHAFMFGNEYAGKLLKCEISRYGAPNHSWGENWRFCKKTVVVSECPAGYTQKGTLYDNNDRAGRGIAKMRRNDIDGCRDECEANGECVAFMYGGSAADMQKNRCELSRFTEPNNSWGDNWRFCAKDGATGVGRRLLESEN